MNKRIEKIFFNGKVHTMNKSNSFATGFAVGNGTIREVYFNNEIEKIAGTEWINLKGKMILPGFCECHMHLLHYAIKKEKEINLKETRTAENMVRTVREFIGDKRIRSGAWVVGSGFDHEQFPEPVLPNKDVLDRISREHPVKLTRMCYHLCLVNSKALELAGIDKNTPDPEGGKIDRDFEGNPNGILRENAIDLINEAMPLVSEKDELKELICASLKDLARVGITTVHTDDFGLVKNKENLLSAYRELEGEGRLPVRVVLQLRAFGLEDIEKYKLLCLQSWQGSEMLKIGPIKLICDGSFGASTAALKEPYSDNPVNYGIEIFPEETLDKLIKRCVDYNFEVTAHAIGDKTIETLLKLYEKYIGEFAAKNLRPSIIHCSVANDRILEKFASNGITANIQPIFLHSDWSMIEKRLGIQRAKTCYCWKKYLQYGIRIVGSSDAPIESMNPLWGIYTAVARKSLSGEPLGGWFSEESLSLDEAIQLFTVNAGYYSHEENIKGSIAVGKKADFIVLSEDLYSVAPDDIKNVKIEKVFLNGNEVC